ncbi:phage holin family protein [Agromyces sp. LHK192]|uniref:phage holin family protein n=1 Tax=Agromyces sp. LHK192 TaxID=2498704 RepID=UPI000FD9014F|nr:phage holin family protein [Agromyces sp. LHK192]
MVRFLIRVAVFLGAAALALFIASLLIPGFHIHLAGFLFAVILYALIQAALEWLVDRLFQKSAPTVAGIAGLLSTFLALWLATLLSDGLSFDGIGAWILAAVVVWVITALLSWLARKFLMPKAEGSPAR